MESIYPIVAIRVNETSWAHVWRLRSRYLRMGYDTQPAITQTHPLSSSSPAPVRTSKSTQISLAPRHHLLDELARPSCHSTLPQTSPWPPAVLPLCACIPAALPLATVMLGSSRSRQAPAAAAWMPSHRLVRLCMGRAPALLPHGAHATAAWPPWHGISPPHLSDSRKWIAPCMSFRSCLLHAAASRWHQASLVPPC
jgi:hypothetical protein